MSECVACHGTGKVTCSKCDGKTTIECDRCEGHGHCQRCDSNGEIACRTCHGGGKTESWSKCPVCNYGRVTNTRWINCSHCHGEGKFYDDRYRSGIRECSYCDGRGQVKEQYEELCPNCHGEHVKRIEKTCRTCHGTGKEKCPRCGGREHEKCSKCGGTGIVTCDKCGGAREVVCGACEGTGNIDVEAMCTSLVNVADELQLSIYKDRVNQDMAAVIFDAANRGVGVAAYIASCLLEEKRYEKLTGGKTSGDYLDISSDAGEMFANYILRVEGLGELDEEDYISFKTWADKGFVPALEILAVQHLIGLDDKECFDEDEYEPRSFFYEGKEAGKDLQKSLEYWKRIIDVKNSNTWNEATIKMAELHVKYLPAIINGDRRAMLTLGQSLLELDNAAVGTRLDAIYLGDHWFDQVVESGDYQLIREVTKCYWDRGMYGHAVGVFKEFSNRINGDTRDLRAMLELGEYLLGFNEEKGDDKYKSEVITIGMSLLQGVIESGDVKIVRELVKFCWDRGTVEEFGKSKGVELCQQLAEGGDGVSQSMFGEYLRVRTSKEGGVKDDYRLALIYLYMAADQGNVSATRRLGHLYRDGNYVEKSRKNANALYVRAAKAGDGWSLYEIGKCYLDGVVVKKNRAEAKRLLKLAADKGIDDAKKLLVTLYDLKEEKVNGPSGIVVGKPDNSSLPKFLKKDYKRADDGKPTKVNERRKRRQKIVRCIQILFGILWRLALAVGIGFLFWWWFEGFNKEALPGMLEQVKGIRGGISRNLSLAMMVSGGTFVASYLLTFLLSKVSISFRGVVQVVSSIMGGLSATALILSGHWCVGGWMAIALICAISYKFENKVHESAWRWILMGIAFLVSGGFGINDNWIISSVLTFVAFGLVVETDDD